MSRDPKDVLGYDVLPEFSHDLNQCLHMAQQEALYQTNYGSTTKSNPDIGRLMFFAKFRLGKDYRGDGGEVRVLRAWCEYFRFQRVPFVTVRTGEKHVYMLKERRAGEEEKQR